MSENKVFLPYQGGYRGRPGREVQKEQTVPRLQQKRGCYQRDNEDTREVFSWGSLAPGGFVMSVCTPCRQRVIG